MISPYLGVVSNPRRRAPRRRPARQRDASRYSLEGSTGLISASTNSRMSRSWSWVQDLPGPVAVTSEAGPTGFDLCRALSGAGIRCEVAAPSKLKKPSGERVKTDVKDAIHLGRLLRLDEITSVSIPSVGQEAARDLVRAREDCRGNRCAHGAGCRSCCCATGSSTTAARRGPGSTTPATPRCTATARARSTDWVSVP